MFGYPPVFHSGIPGSPSGELRPPGNARFPWNLITPVTDVNGDRRVSNVAEQDARRWAVV